MKPEQVLSQIISFALALWLLAGCGGGATEPATAPTPIPATSTETMAAKAAATEAAAAEVAATETASAEVASAEATPTEAITEPPAIVALPDGTPCAFAGTGATLAFNGKRLNYTCEVEGQEVGLLGDLQPQNNGTWLAEKVVLGHNDNGFFIQESEMVTVMAVDAGGGVGMANPASVYCEEQGGRLEIRSEARGEAGYCMFPDGSECKEWAFFRGECLAMSSVVCHELVDEMAQTLGVEVMTTAQIPFTDYITGNTDTGCQLTASGTGLDFANVNAVYQQVTTMLQSQNWLEDIQYAGGGPNGLLTGYRQGDELCLLAIEWSPAAEADCPADQPISACELSPEQMLYSVSLTCAQDTTVALPKTEPERITFAPGAISSEVQGTLAAGGLAQYVLSAMAGQEMTVYLLTDNREEENAALVIWGADGTVLISDHAGATTWTGVLPATQDYYIDVSSLVDTPVAYTLEVIIPPAGDTPPEIQVLPLDVPVGFEGLFGLADSLMLPPNFPVEAGLPAIVPHVITAEPGEYEISLDYGPECRGAGACHYGSLAGKQVSSNQPESTRTIPFTADRAQPVMLENGIEGYFIAAECGANCDDARLYWIYNGFQYMLGLKGGRQADVVDLANAAIRNSLWIDSVTPLVASGPTIESFTIEAQDNPTGGENLILAWQTTGATAVEIWRGPADAAMMWTVEPNGTLTVEYGPDEAFNPQNFNLIAIDTQGNRVDQSQTYAFPCRYALFFDTGQCVDNEAQATAAAEQEFEHGRMLWLQNAPYPNPIVVLYEDGTWQTFADTWQPGEPENDPAIVPPNGLYQPVRGFGEVWRNRPGVRERLGWAVREEQGFESVWQADPPSAKGSPPLVYLRLSNGQIAELFGREDGSWE